MKKFLSLVLALVMTMSLVTVSAGAEDFNDVDDITYVEAVEVMEAIGVVDGDTAGNFNPTNGLTRGAAAKIICNMILGPTTAAALNADTDPFADVDEDSVFAGYIAYCAKEGIVGGYADGTFKPAAPLTGYAFMKMLLGALGYDAAVEGYTGANWSINVAKRAINLGLNDGLVDSFNGSAYVTREEAMLYAFNTLKAVMVEYDAKTQVSVGGAEVIIAGSDAKEVLGGDGDIKADGKLQFAEKYFGNLKQLGGDVDAFMRPATTWKIKNVKVGTYTETPDVSYTENIALGTIYADLGLSEKTNATVYYNGDELANIAVVSKGNSTKLSAVNDPSVGYGTLVDVFYDADAETIDIILVQTYVGTVEEVVEATAKKDAYIVLADVASTNASAMTSSTDEFETDVAFEEDEVVLFTYSEKDDEIISVASADSVTGTLTGRNTNKSVTIDGTKYNFSFKWTLSDGTTNQTDADLEPKNDYVVYLDEYGYAIMVKPVEEISADYALVLDIKDAGEINAYTGAMAKLVFADGTQKTVNLAKDKYKADGGIANNDIVTFRVNDDGKYVIKEISASKYLRDIDTTSFDLDRNKALVTIDSDKDAYANSNTIFVVYNSTTDKWNSYTGIKSVPSIDGSNVNIYAYCKNGITGVPTLNIAYIVVGTGTITNDSADVIFLTATGNSGELDMDSNEDRDYYTYNGVVNNKIGTVDVSADDSVTVSPVMADGALATGVKGALFQDATYVDGVVVDMDAHAYGYYATGITKLDGEYTVALTSSLVKWTVAEDAKIFSVDTDGNIKAIEMKNIKTDSNDEIAYVTDAAGKYITHLYITEVADGADDNTPAGSVSSFMTIDSLNHDGTQFNLVFTNKTGITLAADDEYVVTISANGVVVVTDTVVKGAAIANNDNCLLQVAYPALQNGAVLTVNVKAVDVSENVYYEAQNTFAIV